MFKTNKLISIIVIVLGVLLSGCTGGQDVTPIVKALPEVQQFMKEHPNAKITVTYWSKEDIARSEQEIIKQCDKPITPVAMYKATISDGDLKSIAWIDAETQTLICSTTEGRGETPSNTPTPLPVTTFTPTRTPTPTPTAAAGSSEPRENSEAGVTITAVYLGNNAFEIKMDTHSGSLDYEMDKISYIRDSKGNIIKPEAWDGGIGGHHFSGTLKFPKFDDSADFELVIRDVAGVKERVLKWPAVKFGTPATTATPSPVQTTTPVPSASVELYGEKTDVELGEDIVLKLSAVNLITKPVMTVQVILIPPSGMSVTSSEFVISGAGQYTSTFKLDPGSGKDIEVRIQTNQAGDFKVRGRIVYYFGDNQFTAEDHTLELPIKVREIPKTPTPIPTLSATVEIKGFAFNPATITISKGTTVTWTQKDSAQHTVTGNAFTSDILSQGQTFSYTFNDTGTFEYNCHIHPSMRGKVVVT